MRLSAALLALSATLSLPLAGGANAEGYGIYSSAGWNPAFVTVLPPSHLPPPWLNPAPIGTEPNPMPVPGRVTAFQVGRTVLYNAPPSSRDVYRIVPHPR